MRNRNENSDPKIPLTEVKSKSQPHSGTEAISGTETKSSIETILIHKAIAQPESPNRDLMIFRLEEKTNTIGT